MAYDFSNWGSQYANTQPMSLNYLTEPSGGAPIQGIPQFDPTSFAPAQGGNWWGGALSSTDKNGFTQQGWGMPAIGAAQGIFNGYMGMKQYGLAKQQLAEGKKQFQLNYDAQKSTTNASLEDRQRARVASNPNAYQSVSEYMKNYAIKGA